MKPCEAARTDGSAKAFVAFGVHAQAATHAATSAQSSGGMDGVYADGTTCEAFRRIGRLVRGSAAQARTKPALSFTASGPTAAEDVLAEPVCPATGEAAG